MQLPKGKKNKEELGNRRHIHTKEQPISKYFMHMVSSLAKPKIFEDLSAFQIGAVTGHRAQEHLFSMKSFIAMIEMKHEAIALQLYDISKMFDKEVLVDVLNETYRANVKGKVYKLIYEMNKDVRIKVRTAVGDSDVKELNEIVAQGSLEGAVISTNSISKGIDDFFSDSEYEESYGRITLLPMQFLDDIGRFTNDPIAAQYGNDKLESMAETKLLDYNLLKSSIVILGRKAAREKLREKFEEHNPTFYGEKVKIVMQDTY